MVFAEGAALVDQDPQQLGQVGRVRPGGTPRLDQGEDPFRVGVGQVVVAAVQQAAQQGPAR
ncbi:hypothetical protein ACTWLT_21595 [Micromonospora sp. ZYX-F-536]|uniref:hypothetical protein n=1 Tax=Micromonospora sp. ZYX-F-536 TaxID=3457629 RepID=UPI004040B5FE